MSNAFACYGVCAVFDLRRGGTQRQNGAPTARGFDADGPQQLGHMIGLLLVQEPSKDPKKSDVGQPNALFVPP